MTTVRRAALIVVPIIAMTGLVSSAGHAEPSSPAVEERRQLPFTADVESEYNRGVRARLARQWPDEDARGVLRRLRPLDAARAEELDEAIRKAR